MKTEDTQVLKVAQELVAGTATCAMVAGSLTRLGKVSPKHEKLVHFLYHYVADEDVRARDDEYAKWQQEQLRRLIAEAV